MLSKYYTAGIVYAQAIRDTGIPNLVDRALPFEKYDLINRAIDAIVPNFADLVATDYMIEETINPNNETGVSLSGTGSLNLTNKTITGTWSGNFNAIINKPLIYRGYQNKIYFGIVEKVENNSVVYFVSNKYPTVGGTVYSCLIGKTFPNYPVINLQELSYLPMRVGNIIKMEITSTVTSVVDAVSIYDFHRFDKSALENKSKIVWAYQGEKILLKKGETLTSYGTLTIRYPKLPTKVSADSDYIDVPDGPLVDLVIYKLRNLLAQRAGVAVPDESAKIQILIKTLYAAFNKETTLEEIKNKAVAVE